MSIFGAFKRNKTALILGGGGARGFYHVGVIKALQELEVKIDEITGTSIGAVVGTIYAANPKVNFEKIIESLDFFKIISMITGGFDRGKELKLEKYLKELIEVEKFDDLEIPMSFNAVDVNNAKEIVFKKGDIFPGLIASLSIPGVFPPLEYNDSFLIDGGVLNNIPVSEVLDNQKLIISDITGPIKKVDAKSNPIDVLYSSIAIMQEKMSMELRIKPKELNKKQTVLLTLGDQSISVLDFRKQNYSKLIEAGYKDAMKEKDDIVE